MQASYKGIKINYQAEQEYPNPIKNCKNNCTVTVQHRTTTSN